MDREKSNNAIRWVPALIVSFLFFLNMLPILAPILACFGEKRISSFIYWLYQFTCHQKASRSFFICDHQNGWCARCTFLWFATFASSVVSFYYKPIANYFKGLSFKAALVLVLPLVLDGGIQFIATIYSLYTRTEPFYESTNSIRAITGALFGTGIGLFLFPRLRDEISNNQ